MKNIILFVLFFVLSGCSSNSDGASVVINNNVVDVEVADSFISRYRGLSGRDDLCGDCGMLFSFKEKKEQSFVMRNMNFGLDIIWIDGDKIVKIDKNLPAEGGDYKNIYNSGLPIDYVLEVNAGFAEERDISVDDLIKINYEK